jgi:hypothetical protein
MTTNAAESYMRGWSFAASGQSGDHGGTDPVHARGLAAGTAALACVAGRSREYREGWKAAALGGQLGTSSGAYKLGATDGEVARKAAVATAEKLASVA